MQGSIDEESDRCAERSNQLLRMSSGDTRGSGTTQQEEVDAERSR